MGAAAASLKYSTGFNLPFSGDQLLQDFSFINLKNGATSITAVKNDLSGGGGATSLTAAGGVKLFTQGTPNPNATVSFSGAGGTKFFSTPTADSSQTVSVVNKNGTAHLVTGSTSVSSNQTLANKLGNLTTTQWVLLAGGVGAAVLMFVLLRK